MLLMGNEAITRGIIEAGASIAAAYPGNPSSDIVDTLSKAAKDLDMHMEWSVNEKVALEVAAAAMTGLRGVSAMKQNGLNVACDFLLNLNLSGIRGALVLVICDDPSGISSTNEQDSRLYARMGELPLLEPSSFQEAKDMTREAFELSEELSLPVLLHSVTRLSHARGMGHAGDGNLHPSFTFDRSDADESHRVEAAAAGLFKTTIQLEGTITGEHGIGLSKAPYLAWEHDETALRMMKALKKTFDPRGILNPGKMALND